MRVVGILIIAILFFGCDKRTDVFMFDCVVYDQKVGGPVVDATVIMKVQRAAGGFNPNYETVGSTTTGTNGRFYLEVDKEVFYSYRLEISHDQHFNEIFDISPDDVPISTAYASTFSLEPKSWVSVHLQNDNISQSIAVKTIGESNGCPDCCDGSYRYISGWPVDSVLTCQLYGGQNVEITAVYIDINGDEHGIAETAYVIPFDTTLVPIIY